MSFEEGKSESEAGAEKIEKKRVRGQKKKFDKTKVFNRVIRGNVLDQAHMMESDSSPVPDNFDPVESRPDVISVSDNLQGSSLHQDNSGKKSLNNLGNPTTDIMLLQPG